MPKHSSMTLGNNHGPWGAKFADTPARLADVGPYKASQSAAGGDNPLLAIQEDDRTVWFLANHSPISWVQVGTSVPSSPDEEVKVSGADTNAGKLINKIVASSGVNIDVINPGGNEQLQVSVEEYSVRDEAFSLNTSAAALATKISLTLPAGASSGTYEIRVSYGFDFDNTQNDWISEVHLNGSILGNPMRIEIKDSAGTSGLGGYTDQADYRTRYFKTTLNAGDVLELLWGPSANNIEAGIWEAEICARKVS